MEYQGLLFLAILVLMGISIYFAVAKARKRKERLIAIAREMGWKHEPGNHRPDGAEFGEFEIFRQGHSQYSYNTMQGSCHVGAIAWPAVMGDYHFQVTASCGKSTSTHTHCFSYLLVRLPFAGAPGLLIRREGMADLVKNTFGFDDIDFESAEFSRRFCVRSADRRFAYDVVHPAMMQFLLESRPPTVEIQHICCCLGDGRTVWSPEEFRANVMWMQRFFELWPAHLTAQLEHQT